MTESESELFGGVYGSIAEAVGFIETDLDSCVDTFVHVVGERCDLDGLQVLLDPVAGPIGDVFGALAAGRYGDEAFLLAPMAGNWIAFFEHSRSGPDPRWIVADLPARLGCQTVSVYASKRDFGSTLGFTLRDPERCGVFDAVRLLTVEREPDEPARVHELGASLAAEPVDPLDLGLPELGRVLGSLGIDALTLAAYLPPGQTGMVVHAESAPMT